MLRDFEEEEASDTDDENEGESETDQSEDETEEKIENKMLLDVLDDHHDAAKWPVEWRNSTNLTKLAGKKRYDGTSERNIRRKKQKENKRAECSNDFNDLMQRIKRFLSGRDKLPLTALKKFERRCFRFMHGYKLGKKGPLLDFAMEKY